MPTESGDQKILGNLRKLIDFVAADPNYNPANSKIAIAATGDALHVRTGRDHEHKTQKRLRTK